MPESEQPLHIVCASSLALGREMFETIGRVTVLPEAEITPAVLHDADVLATRSKVRVNDDLLEGSRLKFYGTATAGYDHVDTGALARRGIRWAQAPGSNANSVAEYVLTAMARIALDHRIDWTGKTMGIIGAGHVGSQLAERAGAFGLHVLLNDPPLYDRTHDERYLPLEDVLAAADIITLHVPLEDRGDHPTRGMFDAHCFAGMKKGALFINASRGEVVDEAALKTAHADQTCPHIILDVFHNEPDIDLETLSIADVGTPHIAGYSYDGRVKGTEMIYRSACDALGLNATWQKPREDACKTLGPFRDQQDAQELYRILLSAYDPREDDRALRNGKNGESVGQRFKRLRMHYPDRREFSNVRIDGAGLTPAFRDRLIQLGFIVHSAAH